jgi:nucleoside-diphosphate-sugar epimerase
MVFVTGGTGFLGAHLIYDLLIKGKKVRALKRVGSSIDTTKKIFSYYTSDTGLFDKIEWYDGDILNYSDIETGLKGCQKVYHCAGKVSFNSAEKERILRLNHIGTANIVNASIYTQIQKICFVSSIAALGRNTKNDLITEQTQWETSKYNSAYAISKYKAEMEVWRGTAEGLNAVIVNPSIILGPGNWKKGSSELFHFVAKGFPYYSEGINGFVDVRDVSKAMIKLMESDIVNQRFILNAENISYKKLFFSIADALNIPRPSKKASKFISAIAWRIEKIKSLLTSKSPLITKETARTATCIHRYSSSKIEENLNFSFIPIQQCVEDTVRRYLSDHRM